MKISFFVLLLSAGLVAAEYRPTVLMHGLLAGKEAMSHLQQWITKDFPGIYTHNVEIGDGKLDSMFMDINKQVAEFHDHVKSDPKLAKGFNLVCHSQGGMICRAFIERYNDPPVHNFVSLAGPMDGVYGVPDLNALCPDSLCPWLNSLMDDIVNGGWVSKAVQSHVAFASYWKDPLNYTTYLDTNIFLADINNEKAQKNATYKMHLQSLNTMLLIYAKKDLIVVPRKSPWFNFYKPGEDKIVYPFFETAQYKDDYLGLKEMDHNGKLKFYAADCDHQNLPRQKCKSVYDGHVKPLLNNTL